MGETKSFAPASIPARAWDEVITPPCATYMFSFLATSLMASIVEFISITLIPPSI